MKTALVIIANGSEEIEAVISIDVLRRGDKVHRSTAHALLAYLNYQIDVTVAGLAGVEAVTCAKDTRIVPDCSLADKLSCEYDLVLCPGGLEGAKAMSESPLVGEVLKKQEARNGYVAAVCAGPTIIKTHKVYASHNITSHPFVKEQFDNSGYKYTEDRVCVDRKLVTSRGPGTTFEFALKLVSILVDEDKAKSIAEGMLLSN